MIAKKFVSQYFFVVSFLLWGYSITPTWAAGAGQLSGIVNYNDTPLTEITDVEPTYWIYDDTQGVILDDYTATYNNLTGAYTLGNLPISALTISITFHITGVANTLPGNYRVTQFPDLTQMTAEQMADYTLLAQATIHQLTPWDNSGIDFAIPPADPYPVHSRHLVFQWDAVSGTDHYTFVITTLRDTDFGFVEFVVNTTTQGTSYTVDLEDSADYEHYHSYMNAYNAGNDLIAYYMTTYTNGYGADYRFKVLEYAINLDKVKFKAGKTTGTDSFSITGRFDPSVPVDFVNGQTVSLQMGDLPPWTIQQALDQSSQKAKYSYKGTPNMKLDLEKGTFKVWAKNVDLTGLSAPVSIILTLGSYNGASLAEDEGEEDVINGSKPMPLQFLMWQEDVLRVDKVTCKEDMMGQVKTLVVQGGITLAEDVDLNQIEGTIYWGDQEYPIPMGGLVEKGAGKYLYTKKANESDSSIAVVQIDLAKCTFKITLKNTDMMWQTSPTVLGLELGNFDQDATIDEF